VCGDASGFESRAPHQDLGETPCVRGKAALNPAMPIHASAYAPLRPATGRLLTLVSSESSYALIEQYLVAGHLRPAVTHYQGLDGAEALARFAALSRSIGATAPIAARPTQVIDYLIRLEREIARRETAAPLRAAGAVAQALRSGALADLRTAVAAALLSLGEALDARLVAIGSRYLDGVERLAAGAESRLSLLAVRLPLRSPRRAPELPAASASIAIAAATEAVAAGSLLTAEAPEADTVRT